MILVKGFTGIGAILIFAIGVAMLVVTIWAMKNSEFTFDNYSFLGALLAFDFIIMGVGIIGFCGTRRANGVLLTIFSIFVLMFFAAFLGMGIFAEVSPKYLFDGDCRSSQHNIYIEKAHQASVFSRTLCTSVCPCSLSQQAINNGGYNQVDKAILATFNTSSNGKQNYPDCGIADVNRTEYQQAYAIFTAVEYSLECAGWCDNQSSLIYRFSDVNRGKPKTTCYTKMKDYTNEYANIIGISLIGAAGFMALVCLCNLCLCCSQKQKKFTQRFVVQRGNNYYARV